MGGEPLVESTQVQAPNMRRAHQHRANISQMHDFFYVLVNDDHHRSWSVRDVRINHPTNAVQFLPSADSQTSWPAIDMISPPPTTTVSIDELEAGQELKSLSYFMDLTNFGTFDDCDDDNRAALSVRAICCALPLLNRQMSGYLVVSLATINDTMSITISFNERVFRREFIVRLKHAVQALILNYIEKEFIY